MKNTIKKLLHVHILPIMIFYKYRIIIDTIFEKLLVKINSEYINYSRQRDIDIDYT